MQSENISGIPNKSFTHQLVHLDSATGVLLVGSVEVTLLHEFFILTGPRVDVLCSPCEDGRDAKRAASLEKSQGRDKCQRLRTHVLPSSNKVSITGDWTQKKVKSCSQ